jgi:formyl-CoA transferase
MVSTRRAAALGDVRVVDLSRVLAGPYCTMLLGDLGADVVKVELPGVGDETRRWGPPFVGGESAYFLSVNRNKRSLTLNLKDGRAREVLDRLLATADVLVENFRAGTLEALGLDYDSLKERHPGLVFCTISAFGSRGPRRDRPGYDFAIQAIGGIMSVTGEPDGEPMKVGVAIVDVTAGLYALAAILAALHARERTGRGQRVEVSLLQAQLAWLINVGSAYLVSGERPRRYGNAHPSIVPYQLFQAADGWVAIACGNDAQYRALCQVLGAAELGADERYATNPDRVANRAELIPRLAADVATRPAAELLDALEAAGVPCAPLNTVDQALADRQVEALGAVIQAEHPTVGDLRLIRWPFELSETPAELRQPPPLLGQHTEELLAELGLSAEEIADLRRDGAV